MPNAARATGTTLQLLSPAEIATAISDLVFDHGHRLVVAEPVLPLSEFEKIIALMSSESDNDFSAYKLKTPVSYTHLTLPTKA